MKKNIFDFIENLNPNNIDSFKVSEDKLKVVMTMNDGEKIEFPIKTKLGNYVFYIVLEKIEGQESSKPVLTDVNAYITIANNAMTVNDIRNILLEVGSDANPNDIKTIMLDGFKHANLLALAEQENNLKKYVLIALELLNKLNGDANVVYTNKFRQRILKVGV